MAPAFDGAKFFCCWCTFVVWPTFGTGQTHARARTLRGCNAAAILTPLGCATLNPSRQLPIAALLPRSVALCPAGGFTSLHVSEQEKTTIPLSVEQRREILLGLEPEEAADRLINELDGHCMPHGTRTGNDVKRLADALRAWCEPGEWGTQTAVVAQPAPVTGARGTHKGGFRRAVTFAQSFDCACLKLEPARRSSDTTREWPHPRLIGYGPP